MKREFVYLASFDSKCKKHRIFNNQFDRELEFYILSSLSNLSIAPIIRGTNGIRKIRFTPLIEKRGKSGAYRVFFIDLSKAGKVILLTLLEKHESENLSKAERNSLAKQVTILKEYYQEEG